MLLVQPAPGVFAQAVRKLGNNRITGMSTPFGNVVAVALWIDISRMSPIHRDTVDELQWIRLENCNCDRSICSQLKLWQKPVHPILTHSATPAEGRSLLKGWLKGTEATNHGAVF